jgi:thioredoxin 1
MSAYTASAPTRAEVDALPGGTIIEFGTNWCGFCSAAQPLIAAGLRDIEASHPGLRHLKIEDGPGRALGRSFKVKLWPTLIFIKDGREVTRVVRPASAQAVSDAARQIVA